MVSVEFAGQTVLVTGASSGIGRATALKFAQSGAVVIATSRDEARGRKIEAELQEYSSDSVWIGADIIVSEEIADLFAEIDDLGLSLDVAVNNASTGGSSDKIHKFGLEDWNTTIRGTLSSVFEFMHYELQYFVEKNAGVIVNNASVDGLRGFSYDAAYAAAKHGVVGLTKSAALQYASAGIRINVICPGWIATPPIDRLLDSGELDRNEILSSQPVGRLGMPEEVANVILFLASDRASFMTGAVVPVDGGYLAS